MKSESNQPALRKGKQTPMTGLTERRSRAKESTAAEELAELALDKDYRIREAVAKNPKTPIGVLKRLAEDNDVHVRTAVAWSNPNTTADVLVRLAGDIESAVRSSVGGNTNTPTETLARLAQDKCWDVRAAVARHKSTPPDVLVRLAEEDAVWHVREAVAANPRAPFVVLERLSGDEVKSVREAAVKNIAVHREKLVKQSPLVEDPPCSLWIHRGNGYYNLGSLVLVCAENKEDAETIIREKLDQCGFKDEPLHVSEVVFTKNSVIICDDGEY